MKTTLISVLVLCGVILGSPAWAGKTTVAASKAVAVAGEEQEVVYLFQFDLASLPEGAWIDEAHVEWDVASAPEDGSGEFELYLVSGAWTAAGVLSAPGSVTLAEEAMQTWEIPEMAYARSGGFVRFELDHLVRAWAAGTASNFGLAVRMRPFTTASLAQQAAPTLVVYHAGRSD